MNNRTGWNYIVSLTGSLLTLALLMGQGCPGVTSPWDGWGMMWPYGPGYGMMGPYGMGYGMMWNTGGWDDAEGWGPGALVYQTFTDAPFSITFTVADTDRPIDIVVSGDNQASRLSITVIDPSDEIVAVVEDPSDNFSVAAFTPATAGAYVLNVLEIGEPADLYVARVMQPWHNCPWCPFNNN